MRPLPESLPILALLSLCLWVGCSRTDVAGTSGGGTGSEVVGMVYAPNLSAAAGAQVNVVIADKDPRSAGGFDTTLTANSAGQYRIAGLPAGTYNVLSQKDSLVAYTQNVSIKYDTTGAVIADTIRDTLHSPGSISGIVRLQPGDAATTVFILFLGTTTLTEPYDSTGRFTVANLAPGSYRVRILSTLNTYLPLDTAFVIVAGKSDTLLSPIQLKYTGIPVPGGLSLAYDSLREIVSLSWTKPTAGASVAGYNVYRKESDSTDLVEIAGGVTGSAYVDSSVVQDKTYEYQVAAVDTGGTEGVKSSAVRVTIASAYVFIKDIGDSGTGPGQLWTPADIAYDQNDNLWVLDNSRNKVLKYASDGTFLLEWGISGTDSGQLLTPSGVDIDKEQHIYIADGWSNRIQKFDSAGNYMMRIDSISSQAVIDVSVDDSGFIYAFDAPNSGASTIRKYDSTGTLVETVATPAQSLKSSILARNGKVYVAGMRAHAPYDDNFIECLTGQGILIRSINLRGADNSGTIDIRDLDVDAAGRLYAVESESGRIWVFDAQGNRIASFGRKTLFPQIMGIAMSSNGTIAISDRSRIHLYRLP